MSRYPYRKPSGPTAPTGAPAFRRVVLPTTGDFVGLSLEAGGRLWTCTGYEVASGRATWTHRPEKGAPMRLVTGRVFRPAAFPAATAAEAPAAKIERAEPWSVGDTWTDPEGREWTCREVGSRTVWWEHAKIEEETGDPQSWWRSSGLTKEPTNAPIPSADTANPLRDPWHFGGIYVPASEECVFDPERPYAETSLYLDDRRWVLTEVEQRTGYDALHWESPEPDGVWTVTTGRSVRPDKLRDRMEFLPTSRKVDTSYETYLEEMREYSDYDRPEYEDWALERRRG